MQRWTIILIATGLLAASASATVLHVTLLDGRIQPAIDASQSGDTVLVHPGHYHDRLTIPPHDLTLTSSYLLSGDSLDIANTLIDGDLEGPVITVLEGDRLFRLNGFVITGGWGSYDGATIGGGLWVHADANLQLENLVFTGNGTGHVGGFGAAAASSFGNDGVGSVSVRNVQITDNNHELGSVPWPSGHAFALRSVGRVEVSNLFCNGAGLDDPAFYIDTTDSLFVDSLRVSGYVGNTGTVCGFSSPDYTEIRHVRIENNASNGGTLLMCRPLGPTSLFLQFEDVTVAQNTDSSSSETGTRSFLKLTAERFDARDVIIRGNRHLTDYAIYLSARAYSPLHQLLVEDNVIGSATTFLEGPQGSVSFFENVSLDSATVRNNRTFLVPYEGLAGFGIAPLVAGTYLTINDLEPDSAVWRHVRFQDNTVTEYTAPANKRNGIQGRALRINGLHRGRFLFEDCQWINQRTNLIAPEVDVFPGPRNVGSTVELVGSYGFDGADLEFNDCLFMDNDDGGLYASEAGSGLMRNCRFIRNNRLGFVFYSNNDNAFCHVQNVWITGTDMQEYHLQHPELQGLFHVHGDAGALIENVTASDCSTSFAISLGYEDDEPTVLRNTLLWDVDYGVFIKPESGSEQQGEYAFCVADLPLPGIGNIQVDPQFDAQLGSPWLSPDSPCIDAGDPAPPFDDLEDPANPGWALWPSQGGLRNDIGFTGGPHAAVPDTEWVAVEPIERPAMPRGFTLGDPWPNPFNPTARIAYELAVPSEVRLSVHDLLGRRVAMLTQGRRAAGRYEATIDGAGWASGLYFVTLEAVGRLETRKVLLVR